MGTKAGIYAKRMCLPKKDCYRLFMGDFFAEDSEHVSISFDGKTLFESRAWYYESIHFGDNCSSTGGVCDPNKESMVKFFMSTSKDNRRSPLFWELKRYDDNSGGRIIHSGTQADNLNNTLHYDEICIPKGSCTTFSLGSPEDDSTRFNSARYMLSMDGVTYRKSFYFPDTSLSVNQNLDITYLGDCLETSMANSICSPEDETLVEVNFHTKQQGDDSSTRPFPSLDNFWSVSKMGESGIISTIVGGNDFIRDYEFDSSYRAIYCIPAKECLYSLTVINFDFETYSVKMNGELLTSDTTLEEYNGDTYEVTELGDCNSNSLSGGSIAGIIVAGIIVLLALIRRGKGKN